MCTVDLVGWLVPYLLTYSLRSYVACITHITEQEQMNYMYEGCAIRKTLPSTKVVRNGVWYL
jgi:hypothetical protein